MTFFFPIKPKRPKFQQRHYEFLADAISYAYKHKGVIIADEYVYNVAFDNLVRLLIAEFDRDNQHFDGVKFRAACGVERML